jgi:hypothetical protein
VMELGAHRLRSARLPGARGRRGCLQLLDLPLDFGKFVWCTARPPRPPRLPTAPYLPAPQRSTDPRPNSSLGGDTPLSPRDLAPATPNPPFRYFYITGGENRMALNASLTRANGN